MQSTARARSCIDFDALGNAFEFERPLGHGDVFGVRRLVESLAFDENKDMHEIYVYGEGICGMGSCIGKERPPLCQIDSLVGARSLELRVEGVVPQLRREGGGSGHDERKFFHS